MGERARILVVDDDPDHQAAMAALLTAAGYEVSPAATKEAGLAALTDLEPDLVLLDIIMTGTTDGFHFLYEARQRSDGGIPPVIAVSCVEEETGFRFAPDADEGFFPADAYLRKPVEPAILLQRIEELLGRTGAAATL